MIIQIETLTRYSKADSGKRYNAKEYLYPFVLTLILIQRDVHLGSV